MNENARSLATAIVRPESARAVGRGSEMSNATGGGKAVIPSNVKVGVAGTQIDIPLGHKDDVWSFDHFDTITVFVADAPRPDEILVAMAIADGGRIHPRCGQGPVR